MRTVSFTFLFLLSGALTYAGSVSKKSPAQYGFIENKGQISDQNGKPNPGVTFLFNGPGLNVQLKANSFSYDVYTTELKKKPDWAKIASLPNEQREEFDVLYNFHRIDIQFSGANPTPEISAQNPAADYLNYYNGVTPESGATHVKHYQKVVYKNIYPNIDIEFLVSETSGRSFKYNFIVHPGGNPADIKLNIEGAKNTYLTFKNKHAAIVIETAFGELQETVPMSYQESNGKTFPVDANFTRLENNLYGISVPQYNRLNTLVIDPKPDMRYASYFGGSVIDYAYGITSDASDNIHITGMTTSTTSIATTGAFQTTYGGTGTYQSLGDIFISKFNSSGALQWSTYFGGTGSDAGQSIKVNSSGDIYIEGMSTTTTGMGTTGSFQPSYGGSTYFDVILAKFSSSGARTWSTYYGGTGNDRGNQNCLVLDASGNVYITGTNNTANNSAITTSGAYQTTNGSTSAYDAPFVSKFSPSGAIIFGTYFGGGGSYHNQSYALALDASNNVYMTGGCTGTGFVTTGTHQGSLGGATDAYIVKLNSTGTALLWATYYGGTGNDIGTGIGVDASGNIMLTGYSVSTGNISTTGAYQSTYGGGTYDAFVAYFNASGVRQWGTYLGGSAQDVARSGKMDNLGNIYITGDFSSTGLATSGAYQTTNAGAADAVIAKFNSAGIPQFITYYGGSLEDLPFNIDLDGRGNLYIAGRTVSTSGIATTGAFQTSYTGGTYDAFFSKFQEAGVGNNASVAAFISPTKFCAGNQTVKVRVKNNGMNPIDSVWVNWELDNVLQNPIMLRGRLDTIGGSGRNDTILTVASNVSFVQGIARSIRVYTSMPNNTMDTVNTDDTVFVTLKAGLAGSYTIDPSFGDYNSFTTAVADLNSYGNCGTITFNVTPGVSFTENPVILTTGGTATDTIVFQKAYSGTNPVVYGRNGKGAIDAVIALAGASYITFDGIDVADSSSNTSTTTQMEYGYGITNGSSTLGSSNNRIKNCKITLRRTNVNTIGVAQSTLTAAAGLSGGNHNNRYENIRIENSYNGILLAGTAAFPDSNNIITSSGSDTTIVGAATANDIGNGTAIVYGIQALEQKNVEISRCVVRNLTHTSTLLPAGIWLNNVSSTSQYGKAQIFNNMVFNLSRTITTATGGITGIRIDVSPNATAAVYNNVVYGLSTANPSAASATMLLRGIAQGVTSSNGNAEFYNNSVYINSAATNASHAAFWRAGTGNSTYKNNIFACVIPSQSGTAKHYAAYISSGSVADASHNVLWAPNTNGFAGYATADRATLPQYIAAIGASNTTIGMERGSALADPNFASASDLTFGGSTPASGSGVRITNPPITTDIAGITRSILNPSVGAFETTQSLVDSSAPVISNIIITNGNAPSVFATITDNSGASAAGSVRLWYRLSTSTGAFIGVSPDTAPSGTLNGVYKWTAVFNSLAVGSYQFYIAARDLTAQGLNIAVHPTPNTSFTGFDIYDPVNYLNNPDAAANTRLLTKTTTLAGGTYTVGPTGTYAKLTNVAAALNTNAITGNVIFELQPTYDGTAGETYPIVFNPLMTSGGNWNVTIRPASGATARVTSGDPGSGNPMIRLNGTDRITFDGRPGGLGSNLEWTFRNTRTAATFGAVFSLLNDASYDTLQYLKLESQNTNAASGTLEILGTTGSEGNDNNVFRFNEIRDRSDATGVPGNAVYCGGLEAAPNDNTIFDNNKIFNFSTTGILLAGNGNGSDWNLRNNSIYSSGTSNPSTNISGIAVNSVNTTGIITANKIYGLLTTASGSAASVSGIVVDNGQSITITNNFISLGYNLDSAATINGILDRTFSSVIRFYYNSILISGNAPGSTASSQAYRRNYNSSATVRNNIFKNIRTGGAAHYAIANTSSTPASGWSANYNDLYSANASQLGLWGTTVTNFANWKTLSQRDSNSVNHNPFMVSNTDLHLTGTSLGNFTLAGRAISGFASDIDGQSRHAVYPYMGADEASPALPVDLIDITAHKLKNEVLLNWQTASEQNADAFIVERSLNNESWITAGKVTAAGNSNSIQNYRFVDGLAALGTKGFVYYRLKILDRDGSFAYSKTVSIHLNEEKTPEDHVEVYPNPFTSDVTLRVRTLSNQQFQVQVLDISGKALATETINVLSGQNIYTLHAVEKLNAGIYFIRVLLNGTQTVYKLQKEQ